MSVECKSNGCVAAPPDSCKVYTPLSLAEAMVNALGDEPNARWLEPSHGRGAFVRAISALPVPKHRITALDLERAESQADLLAQTFRGIDFLHWSHVTPKRFDRIIGNPPYVAISQLPLSLQRSATSVLDLRGHPIRKGANTWYAFVVASFHLLKDGGSVAFVLPSAAEYADYSKDLRDTVGSSFRALEIYRCRRPLFPNVQEGTVVAIARGYKRGPCVFRRREVDDLEQLSKILREGSVSVARACRRSSETSKSKHTTLGDLATVGLGGVTGDARFFLLTEARRLKLKLPRKAMIPVVSRARQLKAGIIDKESWERLRAADERIWLFCPHGSALADTHVRNYLSRNSTKGGCKRSNYKIEVRELWYQTAMPSEPHGFISGMSQHGPWICFNRMPRLSATNTLYVIKFNEDITENMRFGWALSMFTASTRRQMRRLGRRYAAGLRKYEPSALKQIRLMPPQKTGSYRSAYLRAVQALLDGRQHDAQRIAEATLQASP
jgi:adenine-specific DNA-methyltransferase